MGYVDFHSHEIANLFSLKALPAATQGCKQD
jgi:hypothetical protein